MDGLGEVCRAAGIEATRAVASEGVGGQGDDGPGVSAFSQGGGGLVTVHHGHLHVHEDHVVAVGEGVL